MDLAMLNDRIGPLNPDCQPPRVLILVTGGTIDKAYDIVHEAMSFSQPSIVEQIVRDLMIDGVDVDHVMQIDSLDMNPALRLEIRDRIDRSACNRILIVHGTSTIGDTAGMLAEAFDEKTIVLTGALKPYRYSASEASGNFGLAIGAARYLPNGVYIAMHGMIEYSSMIAKDSDTARFVLRNTDHP